MNNAPVLKRLLKYLKPYKASLIIALSTLLLSVFGEIITPIIIGKNIDLINTSNNISQNIDLIKDGSLFLLLIVGISFFASITQIYITGMIGQNVMKDLRLETLKHTQKLSLQYLNNTPKGSIVSRITNDVETISEFFNILSLQIFKNIALMSGSITMLLVLNWRLGLVTLITFIPLIVLTEIFRRLARKIYKEVREWTAKVNSFMSEHISAIKIVKIFNKEKWSEDKFETSNKGLLLSLLKEIKLFSTFRPAINMMSSISVAIIIQVSGIATALGLDWVSTGVLFAFIQLAQQFYRPLLQLSENFGIIQSALAGSERVFALLDNNEIIEDSGKISEDKLQIKGKIVFKNVNFEYKKDNPILKKLSFNIKPGEKVAIVGHTGSGKTTITNLITRLWDIQSGSIDIDGFNIKDITLNSLRKQIISVQQDIFLFSGTVRENITLGADLSQKQIIKASKAVNAYDFIMKLPKGFDTEIIENGDNLSTGEKQLLTLARVIAHKPSVVILDEATSNIDTESEQLIQSALKNLFKGRTSIVIAHRLSTIKDADRILVLSEGKIIEQGTHKELLDKKEVYYNLYLLQYADI